MTTLLRDNDAFITLIQVAQSEPKIRRRLVTILSLDKSQRDPALRTFLDEMKLQQKPQEFVAAIACLLSEDVADKALNIIRNELTVAPALTESVGKQLLFAVKLLLSIPITGAASWFVSMGVFWGLHEIGITINPTFGFPTAGLAFVVGIIVGGTIVVNHSRLLLAATAVVLLGAAIALPSFIYARNTSYQEPYIRDPRMIDAVRGSQSQKPKTSDEVLAEKVSRNMTRYHLKNNCYPASLNDIIMSDRYEDRLSASELAKFSYTNEGDQCLVSFVTSEGHTYTIRFRSE